MQTDIPKLKKKKDKWIIELDYTYFTFNSKEEAKQALKNWFGK